LVHAGGAGGAKGLSETLTGVHYKREDEEDCAVEAAHEKRYHRQLLVTQVWLNN
jgi:hypothetical protein